MAKDIHSINLLPNKGVGIVDQFLLWALTIGRLLIILTETLALSVFLYRFSIDMKIIDLNDLIKNQSAVVAQFKNTEDTVRNLQERLSLVNETTKETELATSIFSDVVEMGRGKVTFKNIIVSDTLVKIELQGQSSGILSTFVNNLKAHPEIKTVSIDTVENKISNATIVMNITARLERPENENQEEGIIDPLSDPINP